MARLILASGSPRRRELLTQAGYTFAVQPAHINEDPLPGENPIAYVVRLAREKAEAVLRKADSNLPDVADRGTEGFGTKGLGAAETVVVLGADTTVEVDGQILAKPVDAADAARMLRQLSGRTHRVITGVAVVYTQVLKPDSEAAIRSEVAAEVTGVRFLTMSDAEIAAYVATGEPMDKAGAYGIQGRAARWIPRVEGCYFNVMGLPLALVSTMLEAARIRADL
jgi:septum formation protein